MPMESQTNSLHTRQLAVEVLNRVRLGRRTLDHWLEWADARQKNASTRDHAFLRSLVYGTLRWQQRLDWVIAQFATRPIKTIDPVVLTILRMGAFQLMHQDRVPDSAAVHTSVALSRLFKCAWATGFINKMLRRVAAEGDRITWPDGQNEPVLALSVGHSFPEWLICRWLQRWGMDATVALCRAMNTVPTTTLRTNTLKTSRAELFTRLKDDLPSIAPTRYAPEGLVISESTGPLALKPAFAQGLFQIQDEAAQLVAHLLSPRPGMAVWDACAGLGTKTGHLAQLMENRGRILATDVHMAKLARMVPEMQRLGVTIVRQRDLDLSGGDSLTQLPYFDRILLDAPCSGLGVLRKNPDGKWSTYPADLLRHQRQQIDFLAKAATRLKPGGIVVYAVCSMEPEETRDVIEDFLRCHPEFAIEHLTSIMQIPGIEALMTPMYELSTLPHVHQMDGFFAAALTLHQHKK